MHTSITPGDIRELKKCWPKDSFCIREVNGDHDQHWAVCDDQWNILSLSYTEEEALEILKRFQRKATRKKGE